MFLVIYEIFLEDLIQIYELLHYQGKLKVKTKVKLSS